MATREQNEKEYGNWQTLPDGGRRYWRERKGRINGSQRMIKVVDPDENTRSVIQEIYNDEGVLIERHQKYPEDSGHQVIAKDE
ncbi:MAG: hypothetical protein LCI00_30005 [Chloroflexi bacterium]|nr:hypothetical protein [Chloroflexota bacterium]MCC6894281.1 hypothetical protein [Anaerolineae bacterium]